MVAQWLADLFLKKYRRGPCVNQLMSVLEAGKNQEHDKGHYLSNVWPNFWSELTYAEFSILVNRWEVKLRSNYIIDWLFDDDQKSKES